MASTASCVPFQSGRPLQTTSINAPGIMDGHVDVHGGECNVAADARPGLLADTSDAALEG